MLDTKRLIAEVAARNGIRLDPEDPAFCLVTLNQILLEEAGTKVAHDLQAAVKQFQDAVERLELRAGKSLARDLKEAATSLRQQLERDRASQRLAFSGDSHWVGKMHADAAWLMIGVLLAIVAFVIGVLVGTHLR